MRRAITGLILSLACAVCQAANYSDIWWNPAESGWGLTIADHQTNLFVVWYAYRADGKPVWYTIPGGTLSADRRTFTGDLYLTRGPSYTGAAFDSSQVVATKVGTASLDFAPAGTAAGSVLFSYTLGGVTKTSRIERMSFGNAAAKWGSDFTDLWFNPAESGWGVALAQHGDNVFGVWYAYGADGQPTWFALPGVQFTSPTTFTGKLYSTTGPYYGNATFDPSLVATSEVGAASFRIDLGSGGTGGCDGGSALFAPAIDTPQGTVRYERSACPQAFGSARPAAGNVALEAKGCSGTYTVVARQPGQCMDYGMQETFTGAITLQGIDWTRAGHQAGTLTLTDLPFFYLSMPMTDMMMDMMMGMYGEPVCTAQMLPSVTIPIDLTLASGIDGLSTSGRATTAYGDLQYDLAVTATSLGGHVSYMGVASSVDALQASGSFSCAVN